MGGTTAKLALVDDGEPLVAYSFEAAREKRFLEGSGLPIRISTVELIEIGAGGGSIAHRSTRSALLKVGPESAGAEPGPACYGRGGTEATVTDADSLLGYLNADYFVGGAMQIDRAATDGAFDRLAESLGSRSAEAPGASTTSSTRTWRARRACTSPSAAAIPRRLRAAGTGGAGPVHA